MVPLVVRSHYSLLWGSSSVEALCARAAVLGYTRLALTDVDNLYGLWAFLAACRKHGLEPIVGAEVTDPGDERRRVVCLVENEEGFSNLCRILTRRKRDAGFSLGKDLADLSAGLFLLTGSPELLRSLHGAGAAVAAAVPRGPVAAGHGLRAAAQECGVMAAAVPGSFFAGPEGFSLHRVMRAIGRNTSVSRLEKGDWAPEGAFLAGPEEYAERFAAWPEAVEATHAIAERLAFRGPEARLTMPPWEEGGDAAAVLRVRAYEGARVRYGCDLSEAVVERMEHELAIIRSMGFSSYFLVVAEIVKRSPRTCGRGSGAASLVSYCLGITNVCPVKHNLYFERFLNPGRKDPPDLDVDFAWDERDSVIESVLARFSGRSAMVGSMVLFQPRMAVREAAKVYGLADGEISAVTKKLPWFWRGDAVSGDVVAEMRKLPRMKGMGFPEPWPEVLKTAFLLLSAPRYLSVHPGGVVITPGELCGHAPIEDAKKGVPVLQWDKDGVEDAGLVKIDLLGNRSLAVIRDAVRSVQENKGVFDEAFWEPEDDYATQQAVARGDTMGCFYIESPAMRLLQKKTGVGDFEHLVIASSIIRPAANDWIREYVRRLHGGDWEHLHPLLADVLSETFGIMVYQEDVSRAAVALAGFSHAEADRLRKIMSKKDPGAALTDYRERFFAGAAEKGVGCSTTEAVWEMILSFSGYSFCKPHSASYARVSFAAAYLKTHFGAEFMAAVISNQGGFYSTAAYVSEARRMGIRILRPDVNESRGAWTGKGGELRAGLSAVRDLSVGGRDRIVAQRKTGPYADIGDFYRRVRPDEPEAEALALCGALDGLCPEAARSGILFALARERRRAAARREGGLFGREPSLPLPPMPDPDPLADLRAEFSVLGFLCKGHPMELFREKARAAGAIFARDLPLHAEKRVCAAGWLVTGKVVNTKHDEPMEFLTFEDETGIFETTFFPAAYKAFCHMLDRQRPYLLWGMVDCEWGAVTLTVERVAAMGKA
ncbi:MAG: DNA polymerase III subunit alpha [Thermodesulfobacteriota bacterium]